MPAWQIRFRLRSLAIGMLVAMLFSSCTVAQRSPAAPLAATVTEAMAVTVATVTPTTAPSATPSATSTPAQPTRTPTTQPTAAPSPLPPTATATATQTPTETPAPSSPTAFARVGSAVPRQRVIALDPGHGGGESGSAAGGLVEKGLNLAIALKLADLLRQIGYRVVLSRDSDRSVAEGNTGAYPGVARDLQARVDIANAANADLFLSIHNNGSGDPSQSGTEVWYNKVRPFADRNEAFARLIQESLLASLRAIGYAAFDRGIKDDSAWRIFRGQPYNLYVLGPGDGTRKHEPTRMPGALGESLILSNPGDAAMLRQERTLDALAAGYRDAIERYFEQFPY